MISFWSQKLVHNLMAILRPGHIFTHFCLINASLAVGMSSLDILALHFY